MFTGGFSSVEPIIDLHVEPPDGPPRQTLWDSGTAPLSTIRQAARVQSPRAFWTPRRYGASVARRAAAMVVLAPRRLAEASTQAGRQFLAQVSKQPDILPRTADGFCPRGPCSAATVETREASSFAMGLHLVRTCGLFTQCRPTTFAVTGIKGALPPFTLGAPSPGLLCSSPHWPLRSS